MANRNEKNRIQAEAIILAEQLGRDPDELMELVELGFAQVDTEVHHRLIMATQAHEKEGKTHFALTAPGPIGIIDLDLGTEGVTNKFKGKPVVVKTFHTRKEKGLAGEEYTKSDAEQDWEGIKTAYRALVKSPAIRTMLVDTGTEMWEVARLAKHGRLTEVMPHQYTELNLEFRNLIQSPFMRKDLNAIYLHKLKKEYEGKNWGGKWQRSGFSEIGYAVQCNIEHFRLPEDEDEDRPFGIRVIDCRQNPDLMGEELVGPMCNFGALARMVFPGSKKEDWV